MKPRGQIISRELKAHLPYSVGSVVFALAVVTGFSLVMGQGNPERFGNLSDTAYHISHPLHILLSAAATAAMFWGYQRRLIKTALVSLFGSVVLCSLSDFFIPYIGGLLYDTHLHAHICIIEHAELVLPFLLFGIFAGIAARRTVERSTVLSHSGHVIVSSLASVLYLSTFGGSEWINYLPIVSATVFFAVLIPCCLSDIVVPILFVEGEHLESCLCHHHHGKPATHPTEPTDPAKTDEAKTPTHPHV